MIEVLQSLEQVESHVAGVVSKQSQENGQDMLVCLRLVDQRAECQDILSQSLPDIRELIRLQLVQVRDDLRDENGLLEHLAVLLEATHSGCAHFGFLIFEELAVV